MRARESAMTLDWEATAATFLDVVRRAGAGEPAEWDLSGRRRR